MRLRQIIDYAVIALIFEYRGVGDIRNIGEDLEMIAFEASRLGRGLNEIPSKIIVGTFWNSDCLVRMDFYYRIAVGKALPSILY
jgi:hypothetical protein